MITHTYTYQTTKRTLNKIKTPKNQIIFLTTRTLCLMVGYRVLESKLSGLVHEDSNMFEPIHQDPFPSLPSFHLLLLHLGLQY